jgi:hypothetical protein
MVWINGLDCILFTFPLIYDTQKTGFIFIAYKEGGRYVWKNTTSSPFGMC